MVRRFVKHHLLLVGFLAVLLPLGVMLGLQYGWLSRLQETSAIAEKASLSNYLQAVSNEVEYFYWKQAERGLNIPGELLQIGSSDKVAYHFRKNKVKGARYLFAVQYVQEKWSQFVPDSELWNDLIEHITFYDPYHEITGIPTDPSAERAIRIALAPWRALAVRRDPLQQQAPAVDERDPDNRMILKPITDDHDRVLGVAGMIVENSFFQKVVLPRAIEEALPKFLGQRAEEDFFITVRNGRDRVVMGEEDNEENEEVTAALPFIFTDWTLALGSRGTTPEQWAKSNFLINLSMSLVLSLVLLGGIGIALRTASHEMKLSQIKADFVSNVSHELRTPLASIRVFGEFLRLGRADSAGKSREYGEYIETESRRLTQLINNILDFSKIESEAKTYRFESADIGEILEGVIHTLGISARQRGFELSYASPETAMPEMMLDANAMAQAVTNLVDNAIKYSEEPSPVDVALTRSNNEVVISVSDRGIGIKRGEQSKIFERFHRVGSVLVHDVKGSGLGLSIVQHIVEAHGGRVTVESEPGRGSTFFIHLPIQATRVAAPGHAAVDAAVVSAGQLEES